MDTAQPSPSQLVKSGLQRLCEDFSAVIETLGFARANSASRTWQRRNGNLVEVIHLHRSGSSYGAPRNNSVDIRAEFYTRGLDGNNVGTMLWSDKLKDSSERHYHLRFNALTWSTYDRCLQDLERVTKEHGLVWLSQHTA